MANEKTYSIPDDNSSSEDTGGSSRWDAIAEFKAIASGKLDDPIKKLLAWLEVIFKILLFIFLLCITTWWSNHVIQIVWQAGRIGTGFHLSDTVLVALLTTSIANFLALITILAKSLFPAKEKESIWDKMSKLIPSSKTSGD